MGNSSSSKTKVSSYIEALTNIYTETSQTCATAPANVFEVEQVNVNGDNELSDLTVKQFVSVSQDCFQLAKISTEQEAKIKEQIKNTSEAVTGALNIMSKAKSNSVTEMVTKISTDVQTVVKQELTNLAKNIAALKQTNVNGKNIIKKVDIDQQIIAIQKAVQNSEAVTKARTELDSFIDAESKATVKGLEDAFWQIIIMMILCIVGYVIFQSTMAGGMMGGGGGGMSKSTLILIIITVIVGYMVASYHNDGYIPYYFFSEKNKKKVYIGLLCLFIVLCIILLFKIKSALKGGTQQPPYSPQGPYHPAVYYPYDSYQQQGPPYLPRLPPPPPQQQLPQSPQQQLPQPQNIDVGSFRFKRRSKKK